MKRIRKGDEVVVIAGRSKGQHGRVLSILGSDRLLVENVNMIKRHTRPDPSRNIPGGIVEAEGPIHESNVQLMNPVTNKPDRVGYKTLGDGRKVRIFKSTGEAVDT
ncbi:MAG: 50S ribosomal protein L24 [Xanthomonadales bacterium]|nr:50S ribosomal protein L24 [Xanthomonadales bacterium]NIN59359.1 50S ribosomal protein L24 [Xanthomonadales bacterium]NIN74710.1 50S ribosomal protein L24 [Xanthomonadales bacterium]NIO12610.1 50S ribosomal protein L24 [Xanthomonadales bacterium]NIP11752.1 50S ribosomal protein L24 [Xanthomonadales bacterium]